MMTVKLSGMKGIRSEFIKHEIMQQSFRNYGFLTAGQAMQTGLCHSQENPKQIDIMAVMSTQLQYIRQTKLFLKDIAALAKMNTIVFIIS